MLTDLLEGRRCHCGSRTFSRLWADETESRLSFAIFCEGCGRLDRAVYSSSEPPANRRDTVPTSTN